jgi:hypothetical protein
MKRWTLLLAGVLLFGAACGDSDDSSLSGAAVEQKNQRGVAPKPTPTPQATPTPTPQAKPTPTPTPPPSTGSLSIAAGYKFTPTNREPFGHVLTLKVSGVTLKPDISTTDPVTKATRLVVGVIERQTWGGSAKDPLTTLLHISPENAKLFARLDYTAPAAIEFVVFHLDKAWYTSLGTHPSTSRIKAAGPLAATTKSGDIRISTGQSGNGIPPNSLLTLVLRPGPTVQSLNGPNTSSAATKTSTWGGA